MMILLLRNYLFVFIEYSFLNFFGCKKYFGLILFFSYPLFCFCQPTPSADCSSNGAQFFDVTNPSSTCSGAAFNISAAIGNPALATCAGATNPTDGWAWFTASGTSSTITYAPSSNDPMIFYYSGTCGSLSQLGCKDDLGAGSTESVTFATTTSTNYYVRIVRYNANSGSMNGNLKITSSGAPVNNECAGAISLTPASSCSNTKGTLSNATLSQAVCTGTGTNDVWYKFIANSTSQTITVTPGASMDPVFELFSGTCGSLTSIVCKDDGGVGTSETYAATVTCGSTYYVRVLHFDPGASTTPCFDICVTGTPSLPNCANISSPSNGSTDRCPTTTTLNWTSGGGAPTGYRVYFGTDASATNIQNGLDVGNVLTWNPGSLSNNQLYYWKIIPYNGCGPATGPCTIWSFTTGVGGAISAAGTISGTTPVCQGATGINYSITALSNASSYFWTYSGSGHTINGSSSAITIDYNGSSTSGNLSVYGTNSCGPGTASPNFAITVNPGAPSAPTSNAFSNLGATSFTANWAAVGGASGYKLDVSTDNGFSSYVTGYQDLDVGAVTSYNVTSLSSGTKYYYRVRAYASCNSSSNSTTQSAFTKKYLFTVGSGQEYTLIQSAIDDVYFCWTTVAFDADVEVRVFNGTYTQAITSNSALVPGASSRFLIKAASGQSPIIDGASTRTRGFDISENYVTISGLEVKNHTDDGIKIAGGNAIVENNIVHDNGAYNIIQYSGGNNGIIRYNKCYNTTGAGANQANIWVTASTGVTIQNNLCYGSKGYGIYLSAGANNATVKNNTCYDNGSSTAGGSSSANATYSLGNIGTEFGFDLTSESSTCPGALSVSIPANATITSVNVAYSMIAFNGAYMSEQRSQLRCTSSGGANEASISSGVGGSGGTYNYSRTGLNIANGVTGGGSINFSLHAGRTWGGSGCDAAYNYVGNSTLIITVFYTNPSTYTGAALYIAGSTNIVSTNNVLYAKNTNDYYATYVDGTSSLTTGSGWNNQYSTSTKFCNYLGADKNDLANWNASAWSSTNDDINSDPKFVSATDFHLKSAAPSGTYTGGSWPPTALTGGTWTQYVGNHSPSIDAGNPADSYTSESSFNGNRINQGTYGNTQQGSRTTSDNNSKIEDPTAQIATNAGDIASTATASGSAVGVFKFKIRDLGATGDGVSTFPTQITIAKVTGPADWSTMIAGAKLYNNTTLADVAGTTPVVNASDITITIPAGNLTITNGGNVEVTLKIWLQTTVTDNTDLQFRIAQTSHGCIADPVTSTFASDFGAAVTSNIQAIRVTATKLIFESNKPPATVPDNNPFTVKVLAVDANDNLDVDNTCSVTIQRGGTGTGTLTANGSPTLTQNLSGGSFEWTNVLYATAETFNIYASCATINGTSSNINCISPPGAFSIIAPLNAGNCPGNISISWTASSGATSYDLYWCSVANCDPLSGTLVTPVTSPYTFNASSGQSQYRFKIRANNAAGFELSSNEGTDTTWGSNANFATWSGASSTTWSDGGNWCGSVPTSTVDVSIPGGAPLYPTLTGAANVRNLTIESGASLTCGAQTINVYGNFTNNGTLNAGSGTVNFTGTASTQTVNNGASGSFYHFTVNKASGSVMLQTNGADINGNLTLTSGTLDANNLNISLAGDWSDNGTFTAGTGTVTFDGTGTSTMSRIGSAATIFSDGFENGNQGWTLQSIAGNTEWRIQTGSPRTGSYAVATYDLFDALSNDYCYYSDCGMYAVDIMRTIDLTYYSSATLTYYYKIGYNSAGAGASCNGKIMVDGTSLFADYNKTSFTLKSQSLNAYCGNGEHGLAFRFYQGGGGTSYSPGFIIDDVEISAVSNFETFNNFKVNKTGGGTLQLNSAVVVNDDFEITTGTLNANGKFMNFKGDFTNNGIFTHGSGEVQFTGASTQYIKGSSNTVFYQMSKNSGSELIIGDAISTISVEANNNFEWTNNTDKITVGNGTATSFKINDGLYIQQTCSLETKNSSTVSLQDDYKDYGTYTPNNGTIKFHGAVNSTIIREPASIIYSEDFETGTAGWTLGSSGSNAEWRRQSGFGYLSDNDLAVYDLQFSFPHGYNWPTASAITIDASKEVNLSGYSTVKLHFMYRIGGDANDYGQAIIKVGAVENIVLDNMKTELVWTESGEIDISQYANQSVTLIFRFKYSVAGGLDPGLCIDDVRITTTSTQLETFNHIYVDKTASKSTILWGPIDVNGNVVINQGDLNSGTFNFPVAGDWTVNSTSTFTHRNNTVTFDGSAGQNIYNGSSTSFYNIVVSKTGTASLLTNTLKLDNNLTLSGGTLDANTQDIQIKGNWLNNGGTFTPQTRLVTFNGTGNQNVTSNGATLNSFNNITMNKNSGSILLIDSLTMNGSLKLIKGTFDAATNNRNIRLKGDWLVGDGTTLGSFFPGTALVTFNGTGTQIVNQNTLGAFNLNDFSFYDVRVEGADVRFHLNSTLYKITIRDLNVVSGKVIKIDGQP